MKKEPLFPPLYSLVLPLPFWHHVLLPRFPNEWKRGPSCAKKQLIPDKGCWCTRRSARNSSRRTPTRTQRHAQASANQCTRTPQWVCPTTRRAIERRYALYAERLLNLADRIEARAQILSADGTDVSAALAKVTEARTLIESAQSSGDEAVTEFRSIDPATYEEQRDVALARDLAETSIADFKAARDLLKKQFVYYSLQQNKEPHYDNEKILTSVSPSYLPDYSSRHARWRQNHPADSATTTEDSMMMQPEEEMAVEAKLEAPPSDSTDLNDLDQELNDFTVINEDFSNLWD